MVPGSGTQNDPYIVDTWSDFVAKVGENDVYVELPKRLVRTSDVNVDPNKLYLNADGVVQTNVLPTDLPNLYENTFEFNLNDIAPTGLTSSIAWNCASIKGYGATIRNLNKINTGAVFGGIRSAQIPKIYSLAIINFMTLGAVFSDSAINSGGTFDKCIFSGRVESDSWGSVIDTPYSTAISCGFNVQLINKAVLRSTGSNRPFLTMKYCRVALTGNTTRDQNIQSDNSYITGELSTTITASGQYSIYDIQATSLTSSGTKIVANSEKIPTISGAISATSTQIKDMNYLDQLGFQVQI